MRNTPEVIAAVEMTSLGNKTLEKVELVLSNDVYPFMRMNRLSLFFIWNLITLFLHFSLLIS